MFWRIVGRVRVGGVRAHRQPRPVPARLERPPVGRVHPPRITRTRRLLCSISHAPVGSILATRHARRWACRASAGLTARRRDLAAGPGVDVVPALGSRHQLVPGLAVQRLADDVGVAAVPRHLLDQVEQHPAHGPELHVLRVPRACGTGTGCPRSGISAMIASVSCATSSYSASAHSSVSPSCSWNSASQSRAVLLRQAVRDDTGHPAALALGRVLDQAAQARGRWRSASPWPARRSGRGRSRAGEALLGQVGKESIALVGDRANGSRQGTSSGAVVTPRPSYGRIRAASVRIQTCSHPSPGYSRARQSISTMSTRPSRRRITSRCRPTTLKPARLVRPDRALVVGVHLEQDGMQAKRLEAVGEHQARRLGGVPLPPALLLPDEDVEPGRLVPVVDVSKVGAADRPHRRQLVDQVDDPLLVVLRVAVVPGLLIFDRARAGPTAQRDRDSPGRSPT